VFSVLTLGVSLAFEDELFFEVYHEFIFRADFAPLLSFKYFDCTSIFFVEILV